MAAPSWKELVEWVKPEPAPLEELEFAKEIKTGEYEVYRSRLDNICYEAREVFTRSGISSMLRSGDLIVGIYTKDGDMVDSFCGTFIHAVSAQLPLKFVIKNWKVDPSVGIKEGDVFYTNEALYGGTHNPDQVAIMPIFYNGELVAWSIAAVHQPETGGTDPGGMCPMAKSRYDEGMKLTPIKVAENYVLKNDLLEMMGNMVGRAPRMQTTDVKARLTGCDRIRRRIQELCHEKGVRFVRGLLRRMLSEAEEGARRKISGWNDGTYRAVVFSDVTGFGKPGIVRVCLTIRKEGDRLIWDFTGTSPENYSSWHIFPHGAIAHVAIYLFAYAFSDLPACCGVFAPIDWIFPEGTILNPSPTAAVSNSPTIANTAFSIAPLCFNKMMFDSEQRDLVAAPTPGTAGGPHVISGMNQWGALVSDMTAYLCNVFGHGAREDKDGINTYGFAWCQMGKAPDAEDFENEFPNFILGQRFLEDSCGFGKYRGGSGGELMICTYQVPYVVYTSVSVGGSKVPVGQGVFGGYPPSTMPAVLIRNSDVWEKLERGDKDIPSTIKDVVTQRIIKGEYVFMSGMVPPFPGTQKEVYYLGDGGGCGYGDVLQRDPEMVVKDVKDQIISERAAKEVFGVAYDPETFIVEHERTKELRQKKREERLRIGKRYNEFEKEWLQRKPAEEALEWYGSWPDAKKVKEIMRI